MLSRQAQDDPAVELAVSPRQVCFVAAKAREFSAKDIVTEPDPGSNPADDNEIAVLEDHSDDQALYELTAAINGMNEDEQIDLVALAWLGRDDNTPQDWAELRQEAARAHNKRTAQYLLSMPLLSDYLEQGLSLLGYSCVSFSDNDANT
jgi:hypothetical protein